MNNKEPEPDYLTEDEQRDKKTSNFSRRQNLVHFHTSATPNRYFKEAQNLGVLHNALSYTDRISTDDMDNWVKWREIANEQLSVMIRASPMLEKSLTRPVLEENVLMNIETHFNELFHSLPGHISSKQFVMFGIPRAKLLYLH